MADAAVGGEDLSLRFPAATGGYFDTGGDPDRLEKDNFLGRVTLPNGDGPTRGMVYDGGIIPIEKVPTGPARRSHRGARRPLPTSASTARATCSPTGAPSCSTSSGRSGF